MPKEGGALSLALTPLGHLRLVPGGDADVPLPPPVARRIGNAFSNGWADGLLHLGAGEVDTPLPAALAYWRDIGRLYVERLCTVPGLEARKAAPAVPQPAEELAARVLSVPPMTGAEYLSREVLEAAWRALDEAAARALSAWPGDAASWLRSKNAVWHLVGRVFLHLAEKKGGDGRPFAFLATYTSRLTGAAKVIHLPLGRALREYAGAKEKQLLLSLLEPLHRAAGKSGLVKALVDSGEIFHPLAWTATEAHAFLKEAPLLEESGLVVRVPGWWNSRHPPRPRMQITLGTKAPSRVGLDALLDFSFRPALGDEPLTQAEWKRLLSSANGLVPLRGTWVEIDRERLAEVMERWKEAQRLAQSEGLTFAQAMRLLSGSGVGSDPDAGDDDEAGGWSRVVAGDWLRSVLDELRGPGAAERTNPGGEMKAVLRPYQRAGVTWLYTLSRLGLGGCLADDMGLGKTLQVIALLLLLRRDGDRGPHLVVAPASLLANWQAEISRFAPSLPVFVAHASVSPREQLQRAPTDEIARGAVVLTSYTSLLRLPWLSEVSWTCAVLDEAQAVKNPGARQTRAAAKLKARLRLALTGTPVENRLSDLWSIFHFTCPGLLGTSAQFAELSKKLASRVPPDYAPIRDLVRPYLLRRLKTDRSVIRDLPEKTEVKAFCRLSKAQAALYQRSVDELARKLATLQGIERRGVVLAFLTRFKQICNHPAHWLGHGQWDTAGSGKLARLAEICEEIAARQEKALVFTQFREAAEPLAGYLSGVFGREGLLLHGGTPIGRRRGLVEAFQREDGPPFFVLSLKAGGTGLNLTAASHVVHFDRWWNPAVEDQATDRAFRIGQKKNVLVHKLICSGTVEERIDALVEGKRALSKELLGGGAEALITEMGNDELLSLVSLDVRTALAEA
jgi:superfamily II DNA or RNA helicase